MHEDPEIRATHAFTLVELLVVAAILGLLASLLLPAMKGALDQARSIACVNNLKQMGAAVHMYASSHKNALPPHRHCTLNGAADQASRWEYAKNEGVPTPVADTASTAQNFHPKLFADLLVDDGSLVAETFNCPAKPDDGSDLGDFGGAGTAADAYGRLSLGGRRTVRLFNYAVNARLNSDSGAVARKSSGRPTWSVAVKVDDLLEHPAKAMLYGDNPGNSTYIRYNSFNNPAAPGMHNGKQEVNVLFLDAHVASWRLFPDYAHVFQLGPVAPSATNEAARQFWLWYSRPTPKPTL